MTFFNTTDEDQDQVTIFKEINRKQDDRVFDIFLGRNVPFGASDVERYMPKNTPITSIRRAINTLWRDDKLIRCEKKMGKYKRPEFTYKINGKKK